jgi:hypothetical protein
MLVVDDLTEFLWQMEILVLEEAPLYEIPAHATRIRRHRASGYPLARMGDRRPFMVGNFDVGGYGKG